MNAELIASHKIIINHIQKYREITPAMLISITQMTDFYKLNVIEEYSRIVEALLGILETIQIHSNIYNLIS
jgi:hypothetical protein